MANNVAKNVVERTTKPLLSDVFSGQCKVAQEAASAIFHAVLRTGSALVTDIAGTLDKDNTSKKGLQEKVSGWLERYDFVSPIRDHLWNESLSLVSRDTVIAVDSGDISKEFGGKGMEGMEMGYDASRGVTAMGHSLLSAAVVLRKRATVLRLDLSKGRRGLPEKETALFDSIVEATGGKGIPVHDRGFDSEPFIAHAARSGHRSVIRMKTMSRDLFGTGRSVEEDMSCAPCARVALRSPTRHISAQVRWREGFFPVGDTRFPVLVVSSTFNDKTLYLYALNFTKEVFNTTSLKDCAILAANAYFCRWSVEVLFQDVKQCFSIEDARVRTFRRLENLLAICLLAYTYFAHILPNCAEETQRLFKTMKDTLGEIISNFRPFVANVRALLHLEYTRFISGRPRKRKPPDTAPFLPGF